MAVIIEEFLNQAKWYKNPRLWWAKQKHFSTSELLWLNKVDFWTTKEIVRRLPKIDLGHFRRSGLCDVYGDIFRSAYTVGVFSKTWKHYSGNSWYPVPHPTILCPKVAYHETNILSNLWSGKYGETRLDLMNHINSRITEMMSIIETEMVKHAK